MPTALRDNGFGVATATPSPRRKNFVVAGAAVLGATAMAISPVTPTPPAIQEHAVELAAVVGPIEQLQQSFEATVASVSGLRNNLLTSATPTTRRFLEGTPPLVGELAEATAAGVLNPFGTLTALKAVLDTYAPIYEAGNAASSEALATAIKNMPEIVRNTLQYLSQGQFVEAFSEVNIYVLVALLERPFVPLVPLLTLPGDLATAAGAPIVGNVLDAVFSRRDGVNGLTRAVLAPTITAILQGAVILDEVRAAYEAGDAETALKGAASLPGYVANAFVNGFVPPFPSRSTFPGLLSDGGPVDFVLVDIPRVIAAGLTAPTTPPAGTTVQRLSASTSAPATDAVTLTVDTTAPTKTAVERSGTSRAEGADEPTTVTAGTSGTFEEDALRSSGGAEAGVGVEGASGADGDTRTASRSARGAASESSAKPDKAAASGVSRGGSSDSASSGTE